MECKLMTVLGVGGLFRSFKSILVFVIEFNCNFYISYKNKQIMFIVIVF